MGQGEGQPGGGVGEPPQVRIEMDDLALGEADGFKDAVAAVDEVIVERRQHQAGVAADRAETVFVESEDLVRSGTLLRPEAFDPCLCIQYGNHGEPP